MSVAMTTYMGSARLNSSSQHMLHDGRSTIASTLPSTLEPAVVIDSMSNWVSRSCNHSDGGDAANMAAYPGASRPVRTVTVETMQQAPTAEQVGTASLTMRRSW